MSARIWLSSVALSTFAIFAVVKPGPSAALTAKECSVKYKAAPAASTAAPSGAVFPKSVDARYAKKSAGKARFYTCLDQYKANKSTNGNGGLKWIQKGGGYYSQCNKALKS